MFANTIDLTFSTGTITVVKVNQDGYSSEYLKRTSTKQYQLKIRHSTVKATASRPAYDRHNVEIIVTTFAAADVPESYEKAYFVIEQLPSNTSVVVVDALGDWIAASANANIASLLGWES